MAGGSIVRVGHVRRSAGGNGPLLLSNIGGRNSIYSAVCACTGAVVRTRRLQRDTRVLSRPDALLARRFFTTANGFTSIALRSQWTRKSLWRDLVARSSILSSAAAAPVGQGGKKLGTRRTALQPQGCDHSASGTCRRSPRSEVGRG